MYEIHNRIFVLTVRFLKDRKSFYKVVKNIKKRPNAFGKNTGLKECIYNAIDFYPNRPLASRHIGFDWHDSYEGSEFWSAMSKELENFLNEKKNKLNNEKTI